MKKHIIALSTAIVLCGLNQDGLGKDTIDINGLEYTDCKAGYVYDTSIVARKDGNWYCQTKRTLDEYWKIKPIMNPMPTGSMVTENHYDNYKRVSQLMDGKTWYYPPQKRFLKVENCRGDHVLNGVMGKGLDRRNIRCDIVSTEER